MSVSAGEINIFFVVTTTTIIVVGIALIIALGYIITILRDIRRLSRSVRDESEKIIEDVEMIRTGILSRVAHLFAKPFKNNKKHKKHATKKE